MPFWPRERPLMRPKVTKQSSRALLWRCIPAVISALAAGFFSHGHIDNSAGPTMACWHVQKIRGLGCSACQRTGTKSPPACCSLFTPPTGLPDPSLCVLESPNIYHVHGQAPNTIPEAMLVAFKPVLFCAGACKSMLGLDTRTQGNSSLMKKLLSHSQV